MEKMSISLSKTLYFITQMIHLYSHTNFSARFLDITAISVLYALRF